MKRIAFILSLAFMMAGQILDAQSIAYFNISSVLNGYQYAQEARAFINSQSDQVEAQIAQKTKNLEAEFDAFQRKLEANIYTREQAQYNNAALQRKQNDLNAFAQQKRAEIQQKSDSANNEILALIQDFVTRLNAGGKYSMILATQVAGGVENYMLCLPVVTANPSFDITDTIISGLNAEYAQKKAAQNK